MLIGVIAAVAQGGMNFSTKQIKPNFKKLDPISGSSASSVCRRCGRA